MPPKPPTPKLTHFLCIPLVTPTTRPQLQASLNAFREAAVRTTVRNPNGIYESSIRPLTTLHLTLGVMSLLTPERIQNALTLLDTLDLSAMLSRAFRPKEQKPENSLKITLQGLQPMHDPSSTSILYAPPVESAPLNSFCQQLKDAFTEAELLVEDKRSLLLHATIVNTIYVPGSKRTNLRKAGEGHGKKKNRLVFDASDLIEEWEEFKWMEDARVEKVAICRMGAKVGENGEEAYEEEGSVEMP